MNDIVLDIPKYICTSFSSTINFCLSVVVKSPLEKIKVYILFESEDDNTLKEVQIFNPLLCDLKAIKKTT